MVAKFKQRHVSGRSSPLLSHLRPISFKVPGNGDKPKKRTNKIQYGYIKKTEFMLISTLLMHISPPK
jgi:hypothetical protein